MTKEELAALLTGMEYPLRISKAIVRKAKDAGLVIVYGASDDLIEFEGAIYEELGAYGGTTIEVDAKGIIPDFEDIVGDENKDALRDYFQREGAGKSIEAIWDRDGYSWTYDTDIPHATFEVIDDGEPYCLGIVFSLADVTETPNV